MQPRPIPGLSRPVPLLTVVLELIDLVLGLITTLVLPRETWGKPFQLRSKQVRYVRDLEVFLDVFQHGLTVLQVVLAFARALLAAVIVLQ